MATGDGKGGFGGGPFGGGPFGGSSSSANPTVFEDPILISESLDVYVPLQVDSVFSLSPFLVQVDFSHDLDLGFAANFLPSSYSISSPTLNILSVTPGINPDEVILQTEPQAQTTYLLTVNTARSYAGDVIDLTANTGLFAGFGIQPSFFATAQSNRKVQLTFSTTIVKDAVFLDSATYSVKEIDGTVVPISAVSSPTDVNIPPSIFDSSRLVIELSADLKKGETYVVEILGVVKSTGGLDVFPTTDVFRWDRMDAVISVPISSFSGEVSGGILGTPAGQVYFSPALNVPLPNSSIQVDSVEVCTRAFDVYEVPGIPDPRPIATFGGAITTLLNNTNDVLFATAERLGLARMNLSSSTPYADVWAGPATDGPADATLVETIALSAGGFLNVPEFTMFPGSGSGSNSVTHVVFDGVDQYVDMGNAAALSFTNATPFSLVCWFKSQDTDGALISKQDAATDVGYSVALTTGGKIRVELVNTSGSDEIIIETVGAFNQGTWWHLVVTYDGSSTAAGVTIYANGVAQTSTVVEDTLTGSIANAVEFQLATIEATNSFLNGALDDVAVYDVELTSGQVATIYNAGEPPDLTSVGPTGDLVGYWLMGDGDTFPTLTDNSTNSNDGTMTNMAAADLTAGGAPFTVFTTAANLAPIGAGPTVNVNLQP